MLLITLLFQSVVGKYIAVFDCGSSGTRVLLIEYTDESDVYSFNQQQKNWSSYFYCSNRTRKMTTPESKKALAEDIYKLLIDKGISTLITDKKERSETPLLFYHTAGMRELEKSVQDDINEYLFNFCKDKKEYLVERENFKVLEGWEECLYQWLTVNQVMKQINSPTTMPILHMGGESMQFGLELKEPPEDDFMKSFVYTIKIDNKYHYIFLYSWMKYGTGSLADISHRTKVNAGDTTSPCMYKGGIYEIEVKSDEHPEGGYYYPLKGTADFDKCAELMRPVFTETKDLSKCHGYPPTVADYNQDNCIPFADKFDQLYGGSCVGDAIRYLKKGENDDPVEEPLTFEDVIKYNRLNANKNYDDFLKLNNGDENSAWTMSNAAMTSEFMNKAFCKPTNLGEDKLKKVKMYYKDLYNEKLQAWNLGAAIAYKSSGFSVIQPQNYKESWFTAGRIAGITVGCVAFVGIIVGVIIFIVIRKKRASLDLDINENDNDNDSSA